MITTARIKADLQPAGLDWISALRSDSLRKILDGSETDDGRTRIDALIADDVVGVTSDHFPGERIMVCLNERLRSERSRKRKALLLKTEQALESIARSVRYGKMVVTTTTARRVGAEVNRWKEHPVYPQQHGAFEPYLSIIDAIANIGPERTNELLRASVGPKLEFNQAAAEEKLN